MPKTIQLYAIVQTDGTIIEETCLCANHLTIQNKEWHNLSYGTNSVWLEFDPIDEALRNREINQLNDGRKKRDLSCTKCGYPIDRNLLPGDPDEDE